MPNMNDILRQANIMQNKVAKLQKELADRTVEASSGGGMVKVVATCRQEVKSITYFYEMGGTDKNSELPEFVYRKRFAPYKMTAHLTLYDKAFLNPDSLRLLFLQKNVYPQLFQSTLFVL